MDFGIKGRNALVCAASKGLGFGSALALAKEGVNVTITARGAETLEAAAKQIRAAAPGVTVKTVAGDITTEAGRAEALGVAGTIDILVNNAGGPPPGDFHDRGRAGWRSEEHKSGTQSLKRILYVACCWPKNKQRTK